MIESNQTKVANFVSDKLGYHYKQSRNDLVYLSKTWGTRCKENIEEVYSRTESYLIGFGISEEPNFQTDFNNEKINFESWLEGN